MFRFRQCNTAKANQQITTTNDGERNIIILKFDSKLSKDRRSSENHTFSLQLEAVRGKHIMTFCIICVLSLLNNLSLYSFRKSNFQLKIKLFFSFLLVLGTLVSNLCYPNPCKNPGTCASYECFCPSGWTGTTCDVKTQSCYLNPCQNGGTCNIIGNSITSACRLQFVDPNCESK